MKALILSLLLITPCVYADEVLEEIVVTASRQGSQSLQTIPMSVSVINTETATRLGDSSLSDISVPSLNVEQSGPGLNKIDIRGVATGAADVVNNLEDRPLVAVYVDDTPLAMQGFNPDIKVFDLDRVEVLRGPQGTLYGASSMGGTIRYITKKPSLVDYGGSIEQTISDTVGGGINYGSRASINLPINNSFAVLITGYRGKDSGWINNLENGQKHINSSTTTQGRAVVRYQSDNLTVDTSVLFEELNAGGSNYSMSKLNANQFYSMTPTPINDNMKVYNVTTTLDTSLGKVISSSSVTDRTFGYNDTGEYLSELFFALPAMSTPYVNQNTLSQLTQEVRFVSKQEGSLKWTTGAFYNHAIRKNYQDDNGPGFDQAIGINSLAYGAFHKDSVFSGLENIWEHDVGVFGELTWTPIERLDLTAGVRYFDWHQNFNLYFSGIGAAYDGPGHPATLNNSATASGANPKFVANYHVTDSTIVFAEMARGFRYGGVNQYVPLSVCGQTAPPSYGPDHLWTYSLGEKTSFNDNKIRLNATAFLIKWNQVQTEHYLQCSYAYTENTGQIQSTGGEVEAAYKVTPALTLTLNGSYAHAVSDGSIANINALSGEQTPYTPKYLGSATAEYVVGRYHFNGEYQYHGSSGTRFNPEDPFYRVIPAYSNVNVAASIDLNMWQVSAFVRNVANSNQITMIAPDVLGVQPGDEVAHARPRTIGMRIAYHF